jgi:hypothetical protein
LVFDTYSEVQFVSDDSDNEFTHDFSEDSNGNVEADEEWHERRGEGKARVHHFIEPDPRLIRVVPNISGDSSSSGFFWLIFTEELFSTILTETNATISSTLKKERTEHCK